jgi:transcriptional regulator with XRE-family HTH domain
MISGSELKELRKNKGLTLKDVAKVLKTSEQAVNKYEMEVVRNIPLDRIEVMARLYGVSPSYIMEWEEPSPSIELSSDEERLISLYRSLNRFGKDRALQDLDDLSHIERYIKIADGESVAG